MMLLHFTKSPDAVLNILIHGFAYVALPTKVASFVLPSLPAQNREPQQFGMICFRTEMNGERSLEHRAKFGAFAIVVDEKWAKSEGAQPVLYIDPAGTVAASFRQLMASASTNIREEAERFPEDSARTMAYHNKALAGVFGALEWACLVEIFQFLGPASDEWEREWRIIQKSPVYSIPMTGKEAVAKVSPPLGWARHVNLLKFPRSAVRHLICPSGFGSKLRNLLPVEYHGIRIEEGTA